MRAAANAKSDRTSAVIMVSGARARGSQEQFLAMTEPLADALGAPPSVRSGAACSAPERRFGS